MFKGVGPRFVKTTQIVKINAKSKKKTHFVKKKLTQKDAFRKTGVLQNVKKNQNVLHFAMHDEVRKT